MSGLPFAKYEASGNDFVLIEGELPSPGQVRVLCDRRKGVGADGVISASLDGDGGLRFELMNADGSRAEVSGNGLRCFGAFAFDRGLASAAEIDVSTPAGKRRVWLEPPGSRVTSATVGMGRPSFAPADIPMLWEGEGFIGRPFEGPGGLVATATAVSMGNPHLVLFVEDEPGDYDLAEIGPVLEHHALFPARTNVEFAKVEGEGRIGVRVWERGVGETHSCGTGACAVAVAANRTGLAGSEVAVVFPGGPLDVRLDGDQVFLGGPVAHVFDGVVELPEG